MMRVKKSYSPEFNKDDILQSSTMTEKVKNKD